MPEKAEKGEVDNMRIEYVIISMGAIVTWEISKHIYRTLANVKLYDPNLACSVRFNRFQNKHLMKHFKGLGWTEKK